MVSEKRIMVVKKLGSSIDIINGKHVCAKSYDRNTIEQLRAIKIGAIMDVVIGHTRNGTEQIIKWRVRK